MVVKILKNNINTSYQKHLTLFNREDIEKLLKAGFKFYEIADKIQKHKTTISKEVKRYRTEHKPSNFNNKTNFCKNKNTCTIKNLCNSNCHSECRQCGKCNSICSKFELELCEKLLKPPYVCNACNSYAQCRKIKYIYFASEAQKNMNILFHLLEKVLTLHKKN